MKTFLTILLFLVTVSSNAATIPLSPEVEDRLMALEGSRQPNKAKNIVRAIWDPSGNSNHGSSTVNSGVHNMNGKLPKGAVITDSYFYVVTTPVTTDGRVAFHCEDSANILAASDLGGWSAGQIRSGIQKPGSSTIVGGTIAAFTDSIAAECDVSATVTTRGYSAGKVILYVEYVVAE